MNRWLLALTVLAGGANTCFAPALAAQHAKTVQMSMDSILTFGQLARLDGVTFCVDGKVLSYISADLDSIGRADVEAHEAKHREQYARWKSCKAFQDYYKTPVGRLESEAEAYVAGYCVAVKMGADPVQFKGNYIRNLYALFGGGVMPGVILETWKKYEHCK